MRAIILSAGAGKRLLPLTEKTPKCLLEVADGVSILSFQLRTLAASGVPEATVVVGFGADRIEEHLAAHPVPGLEVRTLYNPFYGSSDNLLSAWAARVHMGDDFLLLNGDALFEPGVLQTLLETPLAPVTLTVNTKKSYDEDDMKVSLEGGRLTGIAKTLPREGVDAESIGLMRFNGRGSEAFQDALEEAVREPSALNLWWLSAVDRLAEAVPVQALDITGLWWSEVDTAEDLDRVRDHLASDPTAISGSLLWAGAPLPDSSRSE